MIFNARKLNIFSYYKRKKYFNLSDKISKKEYIPPMGKIDYSNRSFHIS